jgi:hypothetical protein
MLPRVLRINLGVIKNGRSMACLGLKSKTFVYFVNFVVSILSRYFDFPAFFSASSTI